MIANTASTATPTLEERGVEIIGRLRTIPTEKQISLAEQIALKGMEYRALHLLGSIMLALIVVGAVLVMLLGSRHPVTRALILGFQGAFICITIGALLFALVRWIKRQRLEEPLLPSNLKSRFEYEQGCVSQLLSLGPTEAELERTALAIKAQIERHAGYSGARNEFFRSYKDLLLAALLIFGVTAEGAAGGWADFIFMIKWLGAVLLLGAFGANMRVSFKLNRYRFWLGIIELTRYHLRSTVVLQDKILP